MTAVGAFSCAEQFLCENQQGIWLLTSWFCPGTSYIHYLMKFFPKKVINAELEGKARRVRADEKMGKDWGKGGEESRSKEPLSRKQAWRWGSQFWLAVFLSRMQMYDTELREIHFRLQISFHTMYRKTQRAIAIKNWAHGLESQISHADTQGRVFPLSHSCKCVLCACKIATKIENRDGKIVLSTLLEEMGNSIKKHEKKLTYCLSKASKQPWILPKEKHVNSNQQHLSPDL